MINYAFRVFKLVVIIFSISYFIGTLWYIFTWQANDGKVLKEGEEPENFFQYFHF